MQAAVNKAVAMKTSEMQASFSK